MAVRLRKDYDEGSRVVGRIFGAAAREQESPAAPNVINLDTVQALHRPHTFAYKGRMYRIDKVPWDAGIAIEYAQDQVDRLLQRVVGRDEMEEAYTLIDDTLNLLWRLTRRRWWQRRNPFRDASLAEFFRILSFYSECRTLLPDLALDVSLGSSIRRRRQRLRSIWPTHWDRSRRIIRAGWRRDSRVATSTSG